jgi:predicted flap endonuclease-1-like 5' DNA nuclease
MADATNDVKVRRTKATRWAIAAAILVLGLTLGALNPAIAIVGAVVAFWTVRTGMLTDAPKADGFAAAPVSERFPGDMAAAALGNGGPALAAPADKKAIAAEAPAGDPAESAATAPAPAADLDRPADDLKRIKGIGPKLEAALNAVGVRHYDQIAGWTPQEVAWIDENLEGFKGRATRDDWVAQATILAAGGETEFSARADGTADGTDAAASQG